jgi:rubrerythrin
LSKAIENEKIAGERYQVLADQTEDPQGKAMFRDLANEERMHQRILEDEFFSLSNQGVWGWSGLYGE